MKSPIAWITVSALLMAGLWVNTVSAEPPDATMLFEKVLAATRVPALKLLSPKNEARIYYPTQPLLKWSYTGKLKEAEYYVVRIEYPNGQGECEQAVRVASFKVPLELISYSTFNGRFTWSVAVKRKVGEATACSFAGETIVQSADARRFSWARPIGDATAIVVPQPTNLPTASPSAHPPQVVAPSVGNNAAFPCSSTSLGPISNLCILQPYPVPMGTTAYAVWNIQDFREGAFDKGDGGGFKGPILAQMNVDIPNVTAPRQIRLRWVNKAGQEYIDSMTVLVGPVAISTPSTPIIVTPVVIDQPTVVPVVTPIEIEQPPVPATPTAEATAVVDLPTAAPPA